MLQRGADRAVLSGLNDDDEGSDAIESPEEIQPARSIRTPVMPSEQELAEHRSNGHLPYRDWCPDCVEAFGREWPHKSTHGSGARTIPLISCDYLYITERGVLAKEELQEDEEIRALKALVLFCGATKTIFAHAVPKKGLDQEGYVIEQIKQDVLWLGHPAVIIRGDNEPALVQVIAAASAALRSAGVSSADEGSVPYDPQTNGAAENAVKLLKGTLRSNQLGLERQIKARVPIDHPILTWLVPYAAQVRTMRVRGNDGHTAQQRARGSESATRLLPFG